MGNLCCGGGGAASSTAYTQEDGVRKPAAAPVLQGATSSQESFPDKKEVLARGVKRLSDQSEERAKELFRKYRHRSSTCTPDILLGGSAQWAVPPAPTTGGRRNSSFQDGDGRRNKMREKDLRSLLHDVDPELFQFVWTLFDSGDGVVYADDFVAAMALLATSADVNAGIEEQLQACFVMFDTRGDGRLG